MKRLLPLSGKYGGFETWEEWRRDMENAGVYDPVLAALEARAEAQNAKIAGWIGVGVSLLGVAVSVFFGFRC